MRLENGVPAAEAVVRLGALLAMTSGRPEIAIGLIDGPVAWDHPDLVSTNIRELSGAAGACTRPDSTACAHGTFIAGVLHARRGSGSPAICPGCTLLVRPVFTDGAAGTPAEMPIASPKELAAAIVEIVEAGARLINLSVALAEPSSKFEPELQNALDHAAHRGVIVVAAAGNQGTLGSSAITRHPWVIPVVACDRNGRLVGSSNLGLSIGRQGLAAPGDTITSLRPDGGTTTLSGTSVAVPFVTGAIALLWSIFPSAAASWIRHAVGEGARSPRRSVAPPLLDAAAALQRLDDHYGKRRLAG